MTTLFDLSPPTTRFTLRPYQQECLDATMEAFEEASCVLNVLPTGSGKTIIFGHVIQRFLAFGRCMVMAHRAELIDQARRRVEEVTGVRCAIEMADSWANETIDKCPIVITSVQTQCSQSRIERFDPYEFALLVVDECFPPFTRVDGRPICEIEPGDYVRSFNHDTGRVEKRRVLRRFVRPCGDLVRVTLRNGRVIVCTPNHPIWTDKGYVEASRLDRTMMVGTHDEEERRCEEGCSLVLVGVDSVEVLERSGNERFAELCPDGLVYNLEVQGNNNYFADGILVHNCHHSPARSYKRVIDYYRKNPNLRVLGVTATPDRKDEKALGRIFDAVAYEYQICDAIRDGWLVPIRQRFLRVESLDLSGVRTASDGDLADEQLASVMEAEKTCIGVVNPTYEIAAGRKTLVFASSVRHAEMMAEMFNGHRPGCAAFVCGTTGTQERQEIIEAFRAGRIQFLCNCGIATEGFDVPDIQVISMARPTKSRALYAQCIGRGTRPLAGIVDALSDDSARREAIAASEKPFLEVIDPVGNSGKHKLICTADVLGGRMQDEVVARATRKVKELQGAFDIMDELQKAEREVHDERRRLKARMARVRYSMQTIDPFDVLDIEPERERGWNVGVPASEKQVALLTKMGVEHPDRLTRTRATQLIGQLIRRRQTGMCTYKQAKLLHRYGIETSSLSFEQAQQYIDRLRQNQWRHL